MIIEGFTYANILIHLNRPVNHNNIQKIVKIKNGDTWKHISKDYNFPNKR